MAELLDGRFEHCVISFVDYYRKNASSFRENNIHELEEYNIALIAERFSHIAEELGFTIKSCAEKYDLSQYGISHGKCIDDEIIKHIIGADINVQKDNNQRNECGCVESLDIGLYNTCPHSCKYCYANYSIKTVSKNYESHDKTSPLLCSTILEGDKITDKCVKSLIESQIRFDNI